MLDPQSPPRLDSPNGVSVRLCLLGGAGVTRDGTWVPVPDSALRLLVMVALHGGVMDRRSLAGSLWPDGSDDRAAGNLRSALWRLRCAGLAVLSVEGGALHLDDSVEVDVHSVASWADRLVRGTFTEHDLDMHGRRLDPDDMLPGWYDDWVVVERDRLRQRVLHGLEAASSWLAGAGRFGEAVDAALRAVQLEPLRESAQRLLIQTHLAEGNLVEARRAFDSYAQLLERELGLTADEQLLRGPQVPLPRPPRELS